MMRAKDIPYTAPRNQGWGTITQITLPGGGSLGVYQPHHKRPKPVSAKKAAKKQAAKKKKAVAKKTAKRKSRKK